MSLCCASAGKIAQGVRHTAPESFWKARRVSLLSSLFLFFVKVEVDSLVYSLGPLPPLLPKPAFDLVLLASERNHLLVKGQAVTKECR